MGRTTCLVIYYFVNLSEKSIFWTRILVNFFLLYQISTYNYKNSPNPLQQTMAITIHMCCNLKSTVYFFIQSYKCIYKYKLAWPITVKLVCQLQETKADIALCTHFYIFQSSPILFYTDFPYHCTDHTLVYHVLLLTYYSCKYFSKIGTTDYINGIA